MSVVTRTDVVQLIGNVRETRAKQHKNWREIRGGWKFGGFPYPSTFLLYKSSYSVGERAGTDLYTSQKIVSLKFM